MISRTRSTNNLVKVGITAMLTVGSATSLAGLAELDQLVTDNDVELARSERRVEISSERARAATRQLFPQANARITTGNTERTRFGQTTRFADETYSMSVSQILYNGPAFLEDNRLSAITESERAARKRIGQDRRLTLVETYAQWREAHMRIPLLEERASSIEARLEQADRLLLSRQVSVTDVMAVRSELDRALADARSAMLTLIDDPEALADPQALVEADEWTFSRIGFAQVPAEEHPAVREAQRQLEAAMLGKDQARRSNWPTLTARVQLNRTNQSSDSTEIPETDTAAVQVVANWDFFDSGVTKAQEAEARIEVQDAHLALEQERRDLVQARAQASAALDSAKAAWKAAKDELASAQELLEVTDRRLTQGVGTTRDYLVALERVTEAKIRLQSRWLEGFVAKARQMRHQNALDRAGIEALDDQLRS
jgi:outer membrane protein